MIEFTDWAKDILARSQAAARRFNPDAKIRLAKVGAAVQAQLTDQPRDDDQVFDLDGMMVYIEAGLEGLVDIEELHNRPILKPTSSRPNDRGDH